MWLLFNTMHVDLQINTWNMQWHSSHYENVSGNMCYMLLSEILGNLRQYTCPSLVWIMPSRKNHYVENVGFSMQLRRLHFRCNMDNNKEEHWFDTVSPNWLPFCSDPNDNLNCASCSLSRDAFFLWVSNPIKVLAAGHRQLNAVFLLGFPVSLQITSSSGFGQWGYSWCSF